MAAAVTAPAPPVAVTDPAAAGGDAGLHPVMAGLFDRLRSTWVDGGAIGSEVWAWLSSQILTPAGMLQLAAVVAALAVAGVLARRLRGSLRRRLLPAGDRSATAGEAKRSGERLLALAPVGLPLLWLIFVAIARAGFAWAEEPAPLLVLGERLLLAWVVIRSATALVAGRFWSRLITWAMLAYTLAFVLGLEPMLARVLDDVAFSLGNVRLSLLGLLRGAAVLAVIISIATVALRVIERWLTTIPDLTASSRVLVDKLIRAAVAVVAVLAALHAMGIDATTITVFGGALGLGIGFGLQQIVANLIAGFMLLLDRSVKPGDVITVGDKFGWINAIGARYVAVMTRDGTEHLIPNQHLITTRVENWSHSNRLIRLHAPIGVAYGADVRAAIRLAEQAAGETDRVVRQPPPQCILTGFGDSAVLLDLRFWIADPKNGIHTVTHDILLRVWDAYHRAGIELPFPQRDLHLKSALPVTVVAAPAADLTPAVPPPK